MKTFKVLGGACIAVVAVMIAGAAARAADAKKIGISTIVEVPQLVETKEGVLKGLDLKGRTLFFPI